MVLSVEMLHAKTFFCLFIAFASVGTLVEHSAGDKKVASEMIKWGWWASK